MTTLRATYWWAYGPLVGLASIAPALLDQGSLDDRGTAWRLIAVWAVGSVAAASQMFSRPVLATCVSFMVLGGVELMGSDRGVELSFLDTAPVATCLFATGAIASRRGIHAVVAFIGLVTGAGVVVNRLTAPPESQGGADVLAGLLAMALALLGGFAVRAHREAAEESAQQYDAERLARARAEIEATRRERLRIAREMHDIVAHSVTLLVVNAETLRARRSELPAWAAEQADAMADAGRRAAGEMRDLLRLLRDAEPEEPPGGPPIGQPGVEQVPALVAEARRAGMDVRLTEVGRPGALDPRASLCAYRVVQECLSNARRHGSGTAATVAVEWGAEWLLIEVADAGAPMHGEADAPGLGLTGLRERAAEAGGVVEVDAGPAGFRTRVRLPLAQAVAAAPAPEDQR